MTETSNGDGLSWGDHYDSMFYFIGVLVTPSTAELQLFINKNTGKWFISADIILNINDLLSLTDVDHQEIMMLRLQCGMKFDKETI